MEDRLRLLECLIDSLSDPFVFVDKKHLIQYMNKAAVESYKGKPAEIGRSIFDCHNRESKQIILDVFECLENGEDERIIVDNERQRVFMRAVRDKEGKLLGYFERYQKLADSV